MCANPKLIASTRLGTATRGAGPGKNMELSNFSTDFQKSKSGHLSWLQRLDPAEALCPLGWEPGRQSEGGRQRGFQLGAARASAASRLKPEFIGKQILLYRIFVLLLCCYCIAIVLLLYCYCIAIVLLLYCYCCFPFKSTQTVSPGFLVPSFQFQ